MRRIAISCVCVGLAGCSHFGQLDDTPNLYASVPSDYYVKGFHGRYYNHKNEDDVPRATFVRYVQSRCKGITAPAEIPKQFKPTAGWHGAPYLTYNDWADDNKKAAACVNYVVADTIHNCDVLVGKQNKYSARFGLVIGIVEAASGLIADVYAVGKHNSESGALLAASLAASAGNVQKVFPSQTTIKAGDLLSSAQSYAMLADLDDTDIDNLQGDLLDPGVQITDTMMEHNKLLGSSIKLAYVQVAAAASCPATTWK